jgi:hypothetical protein
MLFEFVPIGWFDGAPAARPEPLAETARPLGALLMAGRIFVDEDVLGPQIRKFRVAMVPQKQGPSAIADEYQRVMRDFEIHEFSGLRWADRLARNT